MANKDSRKHSRSYISWVIVLVVLVAIAVGLGIAVRNKDIFTDFLPPINPGDESKCKNAGGCYVCGSGVVRVDTCPANVWPQGGNHCGCIFADNPTPPINCTKNSDCPNGEHCDVGHDARRGTCIPNEFEGYHSYGLPFPCAKHSSCPHGEYCDFFTGQCKTGYVPQKIHFPVGEWYVPPEEKYITDDGSHENLDVVKIGPGPAVRGLLEITPAKKCSMGCYMTQSGPNHDLCCGKDGM